MDRTTIVRRRSVFMIWAASAGSRRNGGQQGWRQDTQKPPAPVRLPNEMHAVPRLGAMTQRRSDPGSPRSTNPSCQNALSAVDGGRKPQETRGSQPAPAERRHPPTCPASFAPGRYSPGLRCLANQHIGANPLILRSPKLRGFCAAVGPGGGTRGQIPDAWMLISVEAAGHGAALRCRD
jgi:hypothetical protein